MNMSTEFIGVILAAGKGTRMAPFSESLPKPLLPVCNKPVIEYQIDIMRGQGIRDIVILIGHKGYEITKVLGDGSRLGVKIRYAEQTSMLGIAHAVGCLEKFIDKPMLLFLGDIFFIPGKIEEMLSIYEEQGGGAVLATKEEHDPLAIRRNYAIISADDGYVKRVIEKPRHAVNNMKGVGLYLFDLTIFDAIRRTPRTAMRDEYEITESIQVMIDDGMPVRASMCIEDDINLTSPTDLLRCNLAELAAMNEGNIISESAVIHPDATIENSIIGANTKIKNPVCISHSLIFDMVTVNSNQDFYSHIITPNGIVDCKHSI